MTDFSQTKKQLRQTLLIQRRQIPNEVWQQKRTPAFTSKYFLGALDKG
jgi:hypothetical protein